jgi:cytochrome P450
MQIIGFIIPEGWKVLPMFCSVHLDPSVYKDPLKFDPCRWQVRSDTERMNPWDASSSSLFFVS